MRTVQVPRTEGTAAFGRRTASSLHIAVPHPDAPCMTLAEEKGNALQAGAFRSPYSALMRLIKRSPSVQGREGRVKRQGTCNKASHRFRQRLPAQGINTAETEWEGKRSHRFSPVAPKAFQLGLVGSSHLAGRSCARAAAGAASSLAAQGG